MTKCHKSSCVTTCMYFNYFVEYIANMFIKTNMKYLWTVCIKSNIKKN